MRGALVAAGKPRCNVPGRFVAQIFNLLYRRVALGKPVEDSESPECSKRTQNPILRYSRLEICATVALASVLILSATVPVKASTAPYGLTTRTATPAYLSMPPTADGSLPPLLSRTGAFKDLRTLKPADGLIPYELNVPFWSDGAEKTRWVSIPADKIKFAETGEWTFPRGTVFVKTFQFATNEARPDLLRRLETRFIVCDSTGGVYGVTYKWRADNSDGDLLATNATEEIAITGRDGVRTQTWYYPSRTDCLVCHTANAGGVLGVKTRQLNRPFLYPSGVTDNELREWNHAGLFDPPLAEDAPDRLPRLARSDDITRSLEDRARSYLDANCSQCHRPRGTVAYFDARYDTPLAEQGLIGGRVLIDQRIDHPHIIAPNDIWRSLAYMRANSVDAIKMPPLAHNEVDRNGMALLRQWIESLPGPPVLAPPEIAPRGGTYRGAVTVTLKTESGASIHYTLDGTVPDVSDKMYDGPIQLTGPAIFRAKAFKTGYTASITSQEIFVVGE